MAAYTVFDEAFSSVLQIEAVFSDDPQDSGNWTGGKVGVGKLKGTKYGISAASYPELDIRNLTVEQAKIIYYKDYWHILKLNSISEYYPQLAILLFSLCVNCGNVRAAKYLQTGINVLNFTEDLGLMPQRLSPWQTKIIQVLNGKPLKVDGVIGPVTLAMLKTIPHKTAITVAVFGESYKHYSKGKLIYRAGWLNRLGTVFQ